MNSRDSRGTLNHVFSLSATTGKIIPILIQFRFQAFPSVFLTQERRSLSSPTGGRVLLTFSWSFPFLAHARVVPVPFAIHNPLALLVFLSCSYLQAIGQSSSSSSSVQLEVLIVYNEIFNYRQMLQVCFCLELKTKQIWISFPISHPDRDLYTSPSCVIAQPRLGCKENELVLTPQHPNWEHLLGEGSGFGKQPSRPSLLLHT